MLPSELLRKDLEELYDLDLQKYAWSEELRKYIFSLSTDSTYEDIVKSLKEAYTNGYNIGHCGLTSKYLAINIPNSKLHYGKLPILKGTKSSPTGGHAWVVLDGNVIDTTLMIIIPVEKAKNLGYITEKIINDEGVRYLSEYDLFSNEERLQKQDNEAYVKSLRIQRGCKKTAY